jgi:hypothetical protein
VSTECASFMHTLRSTTFTLWVLLICSCGTTTEPNGVYHSNTSIRPKVGSTFTCHYEVLDSNGDLRSDPAPVDYTYTVLAKDTACLDRSRVWSFSVSDRYSPAMMRLIAYRDDGDIETNDANPITWVRLPLTTREPWRQTMDTILDLSSTGGDKYRVFDTVNASYGLESSMIVNGQQLRIIQVMRENNYTSYGTALNDSNWSHSKRIIQYAPNLGVFARVEDWSSYSDPSGRVYSSRVRLTLLHYDLK